MQRRLPVIGASALSAVSLLLLVLLVLLVQVFDGNSTTPPVASVRWPAHSVAVAVASVALPGQARAVMPARPEAAAPSDRAAGVTPITVTAVRQLLVGEFSDVAIGLGANAGVAEVVFTVQFDANVLQARAASGGDWAARAGATHRFAAEISDGEDRVRVRSSTRVQRLVHVAGGSVASVQFQALAPGQTTIVVSDVQLKDAAGKALPHRLSSSVWQLTVTSLPAPSPRSAALPEPSAPIYMKDQMDEVVGLVRRPSCLHLPRRVHAWPTA